VFSDRQRALDYTRANGDFDWEWKQRYGTRAAIPDHLLDIEEYELDLPQYDDRAKAGP
jgi:hypothetical protein